MAFEPRNVSGGGINIFGGKKKHPKLKEYNGKEVLVESAANELECFQVVLDMDRELICVIRQ